MGLFARLAGTVTTFFQIGGPGGVGWNDVGATAIEAKDPTNTTFVIVRGATPVAPNDLVTKGYSDTQFKPIHPTVQFNGNNPLPANTATEKFYIVSTTGPNATIGQVLWDDGTGVGTVHVLAAVDGNTIVTTAGFAGGTVTFAADTVYVWDAAGVAWVSTASSTPGAMQVIDFPIALVNVNSTTSIPANSLIVDAMVTVTTPYPAGTTIAVGRAGQASLLQGTADNFPGTNGNYDAVQRTSWGAGAATVAVAIGGAPAAGAGFVTVRYCAVPNP